jgi:glucokinase
MPEMKKHSIAIDLGGTRIKLGLLTQDAIIAKKIIPADPVNGLAGALQRLHEEIERMLGDHRIPAASLLGIGLAFPGLVNTESKRILSTNKKYDDAPEIDVEEWVENHWGTGFFIDNDARMACVGEWKFGAGQDTNDLVVVTLGTGVGTAVIMDGKLIRGRHFQAGCLGGHFSIQYNGRPCTCGNIGCVEAHASTWSLEERARSSPGFKDSLLSAAPMIDFAALFESAKQNDQLANTIKQECLEIWAAGIINLIHAYDPEVVVLGGGVLNSGSEILPYVMDKVRQHAWCPWGNVQIRATRLFSNACLWGLHYCLQNKL